MLAGKLRNSESASDLGDASSGGNWVVPSCKVIRCVPLYFSWKKGTTWWACHVPSLFLLVLVPFVEVVKTQESSPLCCSEVPSKSPPLNLRHKHRHHHHLSKPTLSLLLCCLQLVFESLFPFMCDFYNRLKLNYQPSLVWD